MDLFDDLSEAECRAEISAIRANLLSNITSISNPTQGGITYRDADQALMIIRLLKAQIAKLKGEKPKNPIKRGGFYGVRPW
ncbi:hypothetical protein [Neorhizobium tomejilense]|uniref:hypothetical protein n=1 Tax=Neorhizobium tomejilense TaxID=2093828 RepID=UPI003ECD8C9F